MNAILLRPAEAAALVGMSRSAFYSAITAGTIPAREIPGYRGVRIHTDDLKLFADRLPVSNPPYQPRANGRS